MSQSKDLKLAAETAIYETRQALTCIRLMLANCTEAEEKSVATVELSAESLHALIAVVNYRLEPVEQFLSHS